jgi:polyhydroxyalkanoate synthase subunit PhaC
MSRISNIFNLRFREDFVSTLSDTVASYSTLAKNTGFGRAYQFSSIWWANWNNNFIEPVRDTFWRTPSHKIAELEKYSLFHYGSISPTGVTSTAAKKL